MMTLYFAPGACSRVPLIALEEIERPFETRLVKFMRGEHRAPDFLSLNPAGKVPLLVVDGTPVSQNTAILSFLAQAFPAAELLPFTGNLMEDSRLLGRLVWFSADLHPLVTRIRMPHFMCDLPGAPARVREMAEKAMALQLATTESALLSSPWVLGERWSILDAYLYWVWFRITGAGFDGSAFPAITAHTSRMEQRPAVARALAREAEAQAELEAAGLAVPLTPAGVLQ